MQFNWNRRFAIMWQREKVLIFICTEIYVRTQSIVVMLKCKNIHVWALFCLFLWIVLLISFGWPSWLFSNNIVLFGLIFAFFVNHSFLISFDWPSRLFSINIVLFWLNLLPFLWIILFWYLLIGPHGSFRLILFFFGLIFCHLGSFVSFHYGLFSVVVKMNNLWVTILR